jgi:hypothetical protein
MHLIEQIQSWLGHRNLGPAVVAPTLQAVALPLQEQWQRVASLAGAGLAAVRHAGELQAKARTQLDAAEFALTEIVEELAGVLRLTATHAASARPAAAPRRALAA